MPQNRKRGQGRPTIHPLPPRIDASPEAIASAFFRSPGNMDTTPRKYDCRSCGSQVIYPDVLFDDGKCSRCHSQTKSVALELGHRGKTMSHEGEFRYRMSEAKRRVRVFGVAMAVVILLAACVPIPQEKPPEQAPVVRAGLIDLASLFANWDDSSQTDEYVDLMVELEKCIWVYLNLDDQASYYTDEEVVANLIYTAGMFVMAAMNARIQAVDRGEIEEYDEEFAIETGRYSYQDLGFAVDVCHEHN